MNQLDLIGTREAANIGRCSIATIKRAARTGELPTVRKLPGETGAYLFERAAVQAWATDLEEAS